MHDKKTLTPMKEATVTPEDDLDLAAIISGQPQGVSKSAVSTLTL